MRIDGSQPRPVLIAGAGPVGLTLALALGRRGLPVLVFEAGETLNASSQASTFHPSTLELLDELGIAWRLLETGNASQRLQYRDRRYGVIAEFDLGLLRDVTRFPVRLQTDQSQLTRLIRAELEAACPSVEVRFATRVVGAESTDDGVEVVVESGTERTTYSGRILVGADGAHSAVRKLSGISFDGSVYESRHLMITTTYNVGEHMPALAPVTYVFDDVEPVALLTLKRVWRVVFMVPESEPDDTALTWTRLQERLATFLPGQKAPYPLVDARIARLHERLADVSSGNVALAGDAAHLNHPLGGMGLNSGIHDAYYLGEIITKLMIGDEGAAALDDYATTRRRIMEQIVLPVADRYSRDSEEKDLERQRERNAELRAIADDPARAKKWLIEASMFASSPLWRGETQGKYHLPEPERAIPTT